MAGTKVHTFPTVGSLSPDYRIPFQYQGPGTFAGKAFTLSLLYMWIESQLTLPENEPVTVTGPYSLVIPAGRWALCVALQSVAAQTINIGETGGGTEYSQIDAGAGTVHRVTLFAFGGSGGSVVYFSGITSSVTITSLII